MGSKWLNFMAKQCILTVTILTATIYVSCESEEMNNQSFVSVPFLRRQDRLERDLGFVRGGANLTLVVRDLAVALPTSTLTLVFGPRIDTRFLQQMIVFLHKENITTKSYSIATNETRDQFCNHIKMVQGQNKGLISVIFSDRPTSFALLSLIRSQNLIQRNILYLFYWELWHPSGPWKLDGILEAMRVAVLTNPRPGTYRIYYSQAGEEVGTMKLVNWWTSPTGLFRTPALPLPSKVYKDLKRRVLRIPVQHKPPWTFLSNKPGQPLVLGGRDHELLRVLSDKLRFRVKYFNPANFSEIVSDNKTRAKSFTGTLDLVSERLADLALGDVTVTFERNQAVEFSFPTLADSGAFVTHSPSPLNEALALVRPFQWQVWPVLVFTVLLSGPILFAVMETPLLWERDFNQENSPKKPKITFLESNKKKHELSIKLGVFKRKVSPDVTQPIQPPKVNQFHRHKSIPTLSPNSLRSKKSPSQVFWQCVWFNLALFLKQNDRIPTDSIKVRLLTILTSFAATYVIGDMYSANLTSLLARPGRERPITNLNELEDAMRTRGYQLLVEKHSSSYAILENGTGIYYDLWFLARRQRSSPLVESGEIGMLRVRDMKNFAMLGGRETLYFDTLRFGAYNFQLSQKLYSRYSAIALQVGCPYIQNVNNILMQLFEAGILTKMTEAEYKKLGDKQYNAHSEHDSATSATPNFSPTESTTTVECEHWPGEYDDDDDDDDDDNDESNLSYDCDNGKDCTTESTIGSDYGGYADGGYADYYPDRYPDYGENQTGETDPPVSDSTVTPTSTPLTPPGGPLSGGLDGPLESPDEEGKRKARTASSEVILKPISIRMVQGAFYVLLLGYGVAALALLLEIGSVRIGRSQCNSQCRIDVTSWVKQWRVAYHRLILLANGVFVRSAKSSIIIDESSASRTATRFSRISWKADGSVDSEMNLIPFCE